MKANSKPEDDKIMKAIFEADTEFVAIVGKSWDLHVIDALKVGLDANLRMIDRTITFLKKHGKKVFFDAEHFFDGFKKNNVYAMKVIEVAVESGADVVVLCDTNGGSMPFEIGDIVAKVQKPPEQNLAFTPIMIQKTQLQIR